MRRSQHAVLLALPIVGLVAGVACTGKTDAGPTACVSKVSPRGAPIMLLQLSRVDFGAPEPSDGGSYRPWRPIGFDLDGQCSPGGETCKPRPNAPASKVRDVTQGIDNAFGRAALPGLTQFTEPSELTTLPSFLRVDADRNGTLFLFARNGVMLRIPLADVRVDSTDGRTGTLGAIVPLRELMTTLREDVGAISELLCTGASFDSLYERMSVAADLPSAGPPDVATECDAISLGMSFEGTTVAEPPPPPLTRCPSDGGTDG